MKVAAFRRLICSRLAQAGGARRIRCAGNVFFAIFAAVAMVGAVGYGFNTVLRGPIAGMTDVTRRTVAESTVITGSRLAIVGATTYQNNGGDCDADTMIEPLPYFDAGSAPHPVGGGWLPRGSGPPVWTLMPNTIDPWKTEYGYCAWDSGSVVANAGCGGATGRLAGSPNKNVQSFVIISAGKNRAFETTCAAYNGATPNAALYAKPGGSDDIVLPYTYAEANDLGNGLWNTKTATPTTLQSSKSLEVTGGAAFSEPVVMTSGGLVLPGDPGDNSLTGVCDAANDKQLRRNIADPANPVLEVCDFTGGLGWSAISGGTGGGGGGGGGVSLPLSGGLMARWRFDESSGTTAFDSWGNSNGTLSNSPVWSPSGGQVKGSLVFNGTNQGVNVPRNAYLEPSAFTATMWVKSYGAQPDYATIIRKDYQTNSGPRYSTFSLNTDSSTDDLLDFSVSGASGYTVYLNGGAAYASNYRIPANQWLFIALSYNPDAAAPQMRAYVNNELIGAGTNTQPLAYDSTSTGNIFIGNSGAGNTNGWNGDIDDVRFYNYQLSPLELEKIYTDTAPKVQNQRPVKSGSAYSWGDDTVGQLGNGAVIGILNSPLEMADNKDFVQISAGNGFACGVKADSTVWCWGNDSYGQLGNGAAGATVAPEKITALTNMVKVSAGDQHACGVDASGTGWCWGNNSAGRLGNGTTTNTDAPVKVSNIADFISISAGFETSCGLRANGEAWCWGRGDVGQTGTGTNTFANLLPVKVSTINDFATVSVGRNNYLACGVRKNGLGYCWGSEQGDNVGNGGAPGGNTPQLVSNITDFTDIQTAQYTSCGLRANGEIWCWGNDGYGQLGNGAAGDSNVPVKVLYFSDFVKLHAGVNNDCGIRKDGSAWCWGYDQYGSLGNGAAGSTDAPTLVGGNFIDISTGNASSYGVISSDFQKTSPSAPRDSYRLAAGSGNTCAINADGTAWCWGIDNQSQIGNGATTGTQESPSGVTNKGPWTQIAVASDSGINNHTCAIHANGNLYCWGYDGAGGLGNGGAAAQNAPFLTGAVTDYWSQVAVAHEGSCGIKSDGTLWCWGRNDFGQVGDGSGSTRQSPVQVGTDKWNYISVGDAYACGIKADGNAYCWGADTAGRLGNGPVLTAAQNTPSLVTEPGPWANISAGEATCGVKMDGSGWCWGEDGIHKIPAVDNPSSPERLPDPGPWAMISSGLSDTPVCGLKVDGTIWCWGEGSSGQIGNGATSDVDVPTQIAGNDWTTVKVGSGGPYNTSHVCAMKSDNSVWCWGGDAQGQLGNGAAVTANQSSPYPAMMPKRPAFSWNSNDVSYSPPVGVNPVIGTTRSISNTGAAGIGLRLAPSGLSTLTQSATGNQLLIDSDGLGLSSQLAFRSTGVSALEDNIPGLAARWKLDASSGTLAVDDIGGNNGTLLNSPTWAPAGGKKAGALTFNGTTQEVQIPRALAIEPPAITISAWVRTNASHPTDATIVNKLWNNGSAPSYVSYKLYLNGGANNVMFTIGQSSGSNTLNTASVGYAIPNSTWVFVTATYDPLGPAPQQKVYINGTLTLSATLTGAMVYNTNLSDLYIAKSANSWNGSIDDVRIYNRALSPDEVSKLFTSYNGINMMRVVGLDYAAGTLEFSRNIMGSDLWAQNIPADLEIDAAGNVGIGTKGKPMAKLDVAGAIKIGTGATCNAARAGTLDYNSGSWRYCTSAGSWATFGMGLGGGSSNSLFQPESITGSNTAFCGIRPNGVAQCWGSGYLGNNVASGSYATPVDVHSDSSSTPWDNWIALSRGVINSCGLRSNGQLWCWGFGTYGVSGDGTLATRLRPVQVQTDTGPGGWSDWISVSVGYYLACGIRTDHTAWCWGRNDSGDLGNNTTTDSTRPVKVHDDVSSTGWSDWLSVKAGENTSCGLRRNGTAWCWGSNTYGKLGNNTTTDSLRPVRVLDSGAGATYWSDWTSVCTNEETSCGVRANGTAWCWGQGSQGRRGDNTTTLSVPRPRQVRDSAGSGTWSDWKKVYCGYSINCGIRANGTLWCWGVGYNTRPTQIADDTGSGYWSDWVSADGIDDSVQCGARANGSAWCRGDGTNGQLGNGTTTTSTYPSRVIK